jgi:hypothetical protein
MIEKRKYKDSKNKREWGHSFNTHRIVGYERVGRIVLLVEHTFLVWNIIFTFMCVLFCMFLNLFK